MQLSEQIVLVTGAGRGLGASIAKAVGREGARVVVNYRASKDGAGAVVEAIGRDRAIALQADVTDRAQVDAMVKQARARVGAPAKTTVNNAQAQCSCNGDVADT